MYTLIMKKTTTELNIGIAQRLIFALDHSGYGNFSTRQLGILFQVTHVTISRWIKGVARPSFSAAYFLCEILSISFEWLYTGKGQMYRPNLTLNEQSLLEIYRNLNQKGQEKLIKTAYIKLATFEIKPRTKIKNQIALKLVTKKQIE